MNDKPTYIGFARVARRFDVCPLTVWRWSRFGRGPQKVKLQALKVGGRWRTRWKWVRQFFAALEPVVTPQLPTRTERRREHEAVMVELRAMGVKC